MLTGVNKKTLKLLITFVLCASEITLSWSDVKLNGKPISSDTGGIRLDSNENGSIDLVLSSDGKLGVGELTPSANLHVSGNVYISGNITLADEIEYSGSGKPNRSLIITAAGATPAASSGVTQTRVGGTNHTFYVLDYDADSDESAFWHWIQPDHYDSGSISVTLYWMAASTTGSVVWGLQTKGITLGEAVDDSLVGSELSTASAQATTNTLNSTTFTTFSPGWEAGDYIVFKVYRDADNGSDDMTGNARLIKAKIEYAAARESD